MKRLIVELSVIIVVTLSWSFFFNAYSRNGISTIGKEEDFRIKAEASSLDLPTILDGFYAGTLCFIDCRHHEVFEFGHIPGAFSMPYDQIEEMMPAFLAIYPHGLEIVAYCDGRDCDASVIVANNLRKMGFERVFIYFGGWDEWVSKGHPIETGNGVNY